MTLVLTALSSDFVVLVSDRRLTDIPTGALRDDDRNKVTLFLDVFACAYSGLSEIAGKRVDVWMMEQLADGPWPEAWVRLATRATRAFATMPYASDIKRQAFVGVGWGLNDIHDARLTPRCIVVTNALDHTLSWRSTSAAHFAIKRHLRGNAHRWSLGPSIGAALMPDELDRLHRRVRPTLKRAPRPIATALCLAETIREVAARDRRVGVDLSAVILPRPTMASRTARVFMPPLNVAGRLLENAMVFDMKTKTGYRVEPTYPNYAGENMYLSPPEVVLRDGKLESMTLYVSKRLPPSMEMGFGVVGVQTGRGLQLVVSTDAAGNVTTRAVELERR